MFSFNFTKIRNNKVNAPAAGGGMQANNKGRAFK